MWLIRTHIGFSCLICLSCIGINVVFKKKLARFKRKERVRFGRIKLVLIMFIPILNVLVPMVLLYMAHIDDVEAELFVMEMERKKK